MDNFETLDFAEFYSETPKTKSEFCERLVVALGKNGFVKLVNHGISKEVIEQAFDIVCFDSSTFSVPAIETQKHNVNHN